MTNPSTSLNDLDITPDLLASGYVTNELNNTKTIGDIYQYLRSLEKEFLRGMQLIDFIHPEYRAKWPIEKVNWWSRPYEYIFILKKLHILYDEGARNFLELGPGCSIIPLYIAQNFPDVKLTLVDTDSNVHDFLRQSFKKIGYSNYTLLSSISGHSLSSTEVFYSVSVVEHIPQALSFLKSIIRQLPSSASFVSTIDVDRSSRGKHGLTRKEINSIVISGEIESTIIDMYRPITASKILSNMNGWFFKELNNADLKQSLTHKLKSFYRDLARPKLNVYKLHLRRV